MDEVARIQADLSPSHPAWPLLTFKLARVYQHTRDPRLKPTLQSLLSNAPGSPYTAEAQEMLARADRVGTVRGRSIGVLLPLTGKYKAFGEAVMRGIRLGLKGSDIEVVVKDTQGDGTRAARAVEELVFDDGVVAAIGPLFSEDAKRAALVAQDLGLASAHPHPQRGRDRHRSRSCSATCSPTRRRRRRWWTGRWAPWATRPSRSSIRTRPTGWR